MLVDIDFNYFLDKCREKLSKFLKFGTKIKAQPQVIFIENMGDFEDYVKDGLSGFQSFLKIRSMYPEILTFFVI
jgi:hypothetical protein